MKHLKSLIIVVILLIFSNASPLSAQNAAGLDFIVEEGFDGFVKSNAWSPIRITASNVGADVQGEIRLKANYPGETYARALSLPSQSQKDVVLYLPLTGSEYTLEFISEDGSLLYRTRHTPRTIPQESFLIGVVSSDPSLLNFLAGLQTMSGLPISVAHLTLDELPDVTQG